jgi:outer membrane protein assembly factor BamB
MALDAKGLYYFNFDAKKLACLDRTTGAPRWTSELLPAPRRQTSFFASKLVVSDGVVLFASGEHSGMTKSGGGETRSDTLTALSAESGTTLWTAKHPPSGYSSPEDLFVVDGTVWCEDSSNGRSDGTVIGFDLKTGAVKATFLADRKNYWFHHRCYSGRATSRYLITSRTGMEFIDLEKRQWDLNHWVRGACLYGIMPSNGLIYTPPAPCICYAESMLHSFNAFAPAVPGDQTAAPTPPAAVRLQKGRAYGQPLEGTAAPGDWPTYRRDAARSGATPISVAPQVKPAWTTKLGGKLSSVTVADGMLFVAAVDRHTVHAINATSGEKLWHFTAGGRVDSPPTFFESRLLFGSADGSVYCLRARDGAPIWRFLAAPRDRRILVCEQIESVWPVHGSVLVREGIAYFVAGRSIFVDGGMRFYRLDAKTGKVISKTTLDDRNPQTGKDVQELVKWLNMPVGRPDILSCDGERIYMRSQAFDLEGKRLAMGPTLAGAREGSRQGGEGTHLFCPTGFLDDSWFHRTYWLYGKTWGSGWCGYYVAGKHAPAGKIISVGDDAVYVFGRKPQYYRWTTPLEYRLFAARKQWEKPPPGATADPKASTKKKTRKAKQAKKKRRQAPAPVTYAKNYVWSQEVPVLARAMTLAGTTLFIAGPDDVLNEGPAALKNEALLVKQEAALAGKAGAALWAISAEDGRKLGELRLPAPPVFDGMAAAQGRLYVSTVTGTLLCLR